MVPLFSEYLTTVAEKVRSELGLMNCEPVTSLLIGFAAEMRRSQSYSVTKEAVRALSGLSEDSFVKHTSLYVRLLDENIVIHETTQDDGVGRVSFTYDEFRDFMLAKELIGSLGWLQPDRDADSVAEEAELVFREEGVWDFLMGSVPYMILLLDEADKKESARALVEFFGRSARGTSDVRHIVLLAMAQLKQPTVVRDVWEEYLLSADSAFRLAAIEVLGGMCARHTEFTLELLRLILRSHRGRSYDSQQTAWQVARQVERLADTSPAEAVGFIQDEVAIASTAARVTMCACLRRTVQAQPLSSMLLLEKYLVDPDPLVQRVAVSTAEHIWATGRASVLERTLLAAEMPGLRQWLGRRKASSVARTQKEETC
jgi:hypothetical protein